MSSGEWTALALAPPPAGEMCTFTLGEHELLLCNVDGELYAIDDRCPHAGVALRDGALRGCILECPQHGGKIDVRSGAPTAPPIRRRVTCYQVRRDANGIAVRLP